MSILHLASVSHALSVMLVSHATHRNADTFQWERTTHGTVAFPRIITGEAVDAFCARCVEQAGVLLLPSTVYDHPPSVAMVRACGWLHMVVCVTVYLVEHLLIFSRYPYSKPTWLLMIPTQ